MRRVIGEAWRVTSVECREATEVENVSRGVTFTYFSSLFPPLDGADPNLSGGEDDELVEFE